ncbi:MAG: hypothetical protein ACFCVC_07950 [Acidimicrobiia bacterium]
MEVIRNAHLVALALLLAACTESGSTDSTGGDAAAATTTTTVATTTSTTMAPTDMTAATCTALKVALFDLDESLGQAFADPEGVDGLSDEEAAVAFLSPLVNFYEELAAISETAPSEVAGPLGGLSESVQPLADILASGDLAGLDLEGTGSPLELTSEYSVEVDAWAAENCGTSTSFDPEQLLTTTLFTAAFGALGGALGELGGSLGELGEGVDGLGGTSSGEVYGDDPELDALWDACEEGDDVACDDLYWSTFGVYEAFAQTCGGRAPYNPNGGGSCEERMVSDGPMAYGDDPNLDTLWDACEAGDTFSCDSLSGSAPVASEYATFGATCGGASENDTPKSCSDPDQAFTYGDDAELDALWDACEQGDAGACSDLFFESPLSSGYETFGDTCETLLGRDQDCTLMVELLKPVRG